MAYLKFVAIILLWWCTVGKSTKCPSGSICVKDRTCAASRNFGQPCGDNRICCEKILNTPIYGKHFEEKPTGYKEDKLKLHKESSQAKNLNKPHASKRNKKGNSPRHRKIILSKEALKILRSYTYKGECGVRRQQQVKISTGHTVDSGITKYAEFPWQAVILIRLNRIRNARGYNDAYKYHCGGVLIDKAVVLTAAHCVNGVRLESLKLKLGEHNLQGTRGETFPVIERRVKRKIIHDNYNPNKLVHDIAILILDRSIDFRRTPHISPICIPPRDLKFEKYTKCFITGYGEDIFKPNYGSNILKAASVTIHEESDCKDLLFQSIKKLSSGFFDSSQRCFTGSSGRDACTGDGGGPVVCPISNTKVPICTSGYGCESEHYFLAGIISWGSEDCGKEDSVTVLTDMLSHRDWLFNELDRSKGYYSNRRGKQDKYSHQSSLTYSDRYSSSRKNGDKYKRDRQRTP